MTFLAGRQFLETGSEFEWVAPARSDLEMTSAAEMTTDTGSEMKTQILFRPSWIYIQSLYRSMRHSTLRMSTSASWAAWA